MGVVFKARQHDPDRIVAIKLIRDARLAGFVQLARFRIEAHAVACVAHANIVRILEVGVHEGQPYFALEFAPGGSLGQRIRGKPQPPRFAAQITKAVAEGLQHAHERRIFHRDLKPDNILLFDDDLPKIADFGLAKFDRLPEMPAEDERLFVSGESICMTAFKNLGAYAEVLREEYRDHVQSAYPQQIETRLTDEDEFLRFASRAIQEKEATQYDAELAATLPDSDLAEFVVQAERQRAGAASTGDGMQAIDWGPAGLREESPVLTHAAMVMGSPGYMPPEQAEGDALNCRAPSDVYALGAVLSELLAGRPPFQGKSSADILYKVKTEPPPPIESNVSADLLRVCMTCLGKKASMRYQTAQALADDLGRFLDGYTTRGTEPASDEHAASRPSSQASEIETIPTPPAHDKARSRWWPFGRR